jgi:transcription antitermination factor NusA-like protein
MAAKMKGSGYDDDAGEGKGAGKGSKKGGSSSNAPLPCVMKFLTPEVLASAIIGKEGKVIAGMRTSCQARLALTEHGDFYPSTDCRTLTAQASEQDSLTEVSRQVVAKVVELAKTPSEAVGSEDELKLRTLVPRAAVGGIIGKGGAAIKQLRESSGAKISISEPIGSGPGAEQIVSLTGTAQALELVLKEVNSQIQTLNGESWFQQWASPATIAAATAGYGASMGMPFRSGAGMNPPGVDVMIRVAQQLPSYVMQDDRGFALSCVVPNKLVGGLIGRGGSGTKEVQMMTGTKIGIRDIPGDTENRSMNIAGPLASTCAAYMLMMQRYLDAEASAASSGNNGS